MGTGSVTFGAANRTSSQTQRQPVGRSGPLYPDLSGVRALITGAQSAVGVDIAAQFTHQGVRLLLETEADAPQIPTNDFAPGATVIEIKRVGGKGSDGARTTAQTAAKAFGSIDVMLNLITMPESGWPEITGPDDLEDTLAERLSAAIVGTQVTANRMGLTWTPGVIVNVLHAPQSDARDPMIDLLVRDALSTLTHLEADKWAAQGIRVNALISTGDDQSAIARTAMRVCSAECAELSGLVFEV